MLKRWLPLLLVAQVCCLVVAAVWAVHRHAARPASPAPRIVPAQRPYQDIGTAQAGRLVTPPVPFRTEHPPANPFNLRSTGLEETTGRARGNADAPAPRARAQDLPPGTKGLELNGATVYYEPLGR